MAIGTAVVLVATGAGLGIYFGTRGGSGSSSGSLVSVSTEKVTVSTGTLKRTVSASGTLVPAQDSALTFGVGGTVTAVGVSVGQSVTTGQTLATLNPTALSDQVAADEATVTADQDRLATDQANNAATSQIDSDQAALTSAESNLSTAQANLSDTTLRATFDGTVAAVNLAVGDLVSGGGTGGGGSSNSGNNSAGSGGTGTGSSSSNSSGSSSSSQGITVISANSYTVSTSVDDTQVGQLKVGDQAQMTLSGTGAASGVFGGAAAGGASTATTTPSAAGANSTISNSTIYGTVSSVSLVASSSSSSVASFPVTIAVTGSPSGLYAGASVSVSITTEQLNNVVEVPTAAISYTTGSPTVTEVVNGKNVTQPVTTGISAGGETQITSGLSAGSTIVERVVRFNPSAAGSARTLFGGTGGGGGRFFGGGGGAGGGGRFFGGGGGGSGGGSNGGGAFFSGGGG